MRDRNKWLVVLCGIRARIARPENTPPAHFVSSLVVYFAIIEASIGAAQTLRSQSPGKIRISGPPFRSQNLKNERRQLKERENLGGVSLCSQIRL